LVKPLRAVLFDFGGTLYDYRTLEPGAIESLLALVRGLGIEAEPRAVHRAHQEAMKKVFRDYLRRPYFLHADFFRDAVVEMVRSLGSETTAEALEEYRRRQWSLHERDFRLREGVPETLAELKRRGLHLGIVSNIDEDQLAHLGRLAGLERWFDSILSSERAGSCKPDQTIFACALERAGCGADAAIFVGDALDQDIAGAKRAGIRSVLIWHRGDRALPDRDPRPDHVITRIPELLDVIDRARS
jgi:2-haloalkanoic acid dehalogenase type II